MVSSELPGLWETIGQALALRKSIFIAIQEAPHGLWVALLVVGLAGLSEAFGQSLVLFINHVRPRRFILAVLFSTLSYMIGFALWTGVVWAVGVYVFGREVALVPIAAAVGLAYAPQILAFFELTPFLGGPFGVLLSLWSLLALLVALRAGLGVETFQAIVAGGLGWLIVQAWRRTLGLPIAALGRWVEQRAAGVPLRYRAGDVPRLRRRPAWLQSLDLRRRLAANRDLPAAPRDRTENQPRKS